MADIIDEINTIGDLLASIGVTRFYKQDLPKTYVANTIGIRWQGDTDIGRTADFYEIDRTYQVIYFGSNNVDCLNKTKLMRNLLSEYVGKKVKMRDSDEYMTFESFVMTAPFKTETDGVCAVSGVLNVTVREAHKRPTFVKMGELSTDINGGGN